jgi:exodeoxyribonuclease VII small subunit
LGFDFAKLASSLRPPRRPKVKKVMIDDEEAQIAALSFEQALLELERIVAELESGDADLERAVDVYQRGARLRAHCEAKLKAAQLKVEKIIQGPSGAVGVEPAEFA